MVRVDYDARHLTLTRPDKFVYRGTGVVLPLRLHGHIPVVEGTADGVKGLFALDTGSGSALDPSGRSSRPMICGASTQPGSHRKRASAWEAPHGRSSSMSGV